MTAQDKQNGDAQLRSLVRRQLLLLDFQTEDNPTAARTWPEFPNLSPRESYHLFGVMERWGWVAGSQVNATEIKCVITSEGSKALNLLKSGRQPDETDSQSFTDEDRRVLWPLNERIEQFPDAPAPVNRVWTALRWSWSTINNLRLGPASTLCYGLAAAVVGTQYVTAGSPLMRWGLLLIVLGTVIFAGRLAVATRPFSSARASFRWLPLGVSAVVILPLWLFIPEHRESLYSTYYGFALLGLAALSLVFEP